MHILPLFNYNCNLKRVSITKKWDASQYSNLLLMESSIEKSAPTWLNEAIVSHKVRRDWNVRQNWVSSLAKVAPKG